MFISKKMGQTASFRHLNVFHKWYTYISVTTNEHDGKRTLLDDYESTSKQKVSLTLCPEQNNFEFINGFTSTWSTFDTNTNITDKPVHFPSNTEGGTTKS